MCATQDKHLVAMMRSWKKRKKCCEMQNTLMQLKNPQMFVSQLMGVNTLKHATSVGINVITGWTWSASAIYLFFNRVMAAHKCIYLKLLLSINQQSSVFFECISIYQ